MPCTLHVAWNERLAGYDFGPGHPMAPIRLKLTMELARAFGLFGLDGVAVEVPAAATRAELELYHSPGYIDIVRLADSGKLLSLGKQDMIERILHMHGLGTEDDPVFPDMHEAASMVTGATLAAARAVWTSTAQHGASIAGGLHPRYARERQRILRLQRPGDRDRLAARPGREADRVRRRGRPSRGRGGAGVLGRPQGADHRTARAPGIAVPGHWVAR